MCVRLLMVCAHIIARAAVERVGGFYIDALWLVFNHAKRLSAFGTGCLDTRAIHAGLSFLAADIARTCAVCAAILIVRQRIGARYDGFRAHAADLARVAVVLACAVRAQLAALAFDRRLATGAGRVLHANAVVEVIADFAHIRYALTIHATASFPARNHRAALNVVIATVLRAVLFADVLIDVLAFFARRARCAFAVLDLIDVFALRRDALGRETFVFKAKAASALRIVVAFHKAVHVFAYAGNPSDVALFADFAMAAAVIKVVGFANSLIEMLATVAAKASDTGAIKREIAVALVAFGRITLAVQTIAVAPAADHVHADISVGAAVIDVIVLADAFIIMLIDIAFCARDARFARKNIAFFLIAFCRLTLAIDTCAAQPAFHFDRACISRLAAIIQVIRFADAFVQMLAGGAFQKRLAFAVVERVTVFARARDAAAPLARTASPARNFRTRIVMLTAVRVRIRLALPFINMLVWLALNLAAVIGAIAVLRAFRNIRWASVYLKINLVIP